MFEGIIFNISATFLPLLWLTGLSILHFKMILFKHRAMFPSSGEWCRAGRDKTMEDKQINCCISGTSSAVQHNLGCLASWVGRDFSVQLIRSEFTSSIGISHPSISFWSSCAVKSSAVTKSKGSTDLQGEHWVGAGKAGGMVAPYQENHTEVEREGMGYDGWN